MATRTKRSVAAIAVLGVLAGCSEQPRSAPQSGDLSVVTIAGADTGFYQELSWSPDGKTLLVSVLEMALDTSGFAYRIFAVQVDGSSASALTMGPRDYWTTWSPDGRRFAFNGQSGSSSDIFVSAAGGSAPVALTASPGQDVQPDWSPDGRRIAFVSDRGGREQVWVMNADGSEQRVLFEGAGQAQNPRWSPDGRRLAWFEMFGGGNDSLVVGNADGSGRRVIGAGIWPSWAPGDRLLFTGPDGLYLVAPDGAGRRQLLAGEIVNGEFSADGSRLAFIEKAGGDIMVVVAQADGTARQVLLRRPAPKW